MRPSRARRAKHLPLRKIKSNSEKSAKHVIAAVSAVVLLVVGVWAWWPRAGSGTTDRIALLPEMLAPEIWNGVAEQSTANEFVTNSGELSRGPDEFADGVRRALADLIRLFPGDPIAYTLKAQVETDLGDTTAALRSWKQEIQLAPSNAGPYFAVGQILTERGDYEKAEAFVRAGLTAQPGSEFGSTLLANALFHEGKLRDVILFLEGAADADRAPIPCLLILGQAFIGVDEYEKAERCFRSATALAPEEPSGWYGLATASARLGKTKEAAEYRQRFKQVEASNEASAGSTEDGDAEDTADVNRRIAAAHQRIAEFYASRQLWTAAEEQFALASRVAAKGAK